MSSKIANEVRKIFTLTGTLEPSSDRMPSAKAMSVAVGIAHPYIARLSPLLNQA
jgi:hypothetical protein